jgi:hypothetical protein
MALAKEITVTHCKIVENPIQAAIQGCFACFDLSHSSWCWLLMMFTSLVLSESQTPWVSQHHQL